MSDSRSSRRRKYSSSSESSVDSAENERRKDLQERDEFATRLRQKDETKTRKVLEVKKKHFNFKRSRIPFLTENQLNRFQIKRVLKKRQSDSNLSWKTGNRSFQIYVFNLEELIWRSERKIKLPNWKPIFRMMNICLMNQCK